MRVAIQHVCWRLRLSHFKALPRLLLIQLAEAAAAALLHADGVEHRAQELLVLLLLLLRLSIPSWLLQLPGQGSAQLGHGVLLANVVG
jgi:hypothetical protein